MVDLDQLKESNPIQTVINDEYPLVGHGRYLRGGHPGQPHDSLVVDTFTQAYWWNSKGERGDVITWVMKRRNADFKGAVEWLSARANLPAPQWGGEDAKTAQERRARSEALTVAAVYFAGNLDQAARDYCYWRGWTDATIERAGLGLAGGSGLGAALRSAGIDPQGPAARAALDIPAGMLVFPHYESGRVVYLSARSASRKEKRHYNPPADLLGERRRYVNREYSPLAQQVVVVEGQSDAVTLDQWGVAALALAGTAVDEVLLQQLRRHRDICAALDQDEAGVKASRQICDALGPMTRVVTWPAKDANAWLQEGGTSETCRALLAAAPLWVEVVAAEAGQADPADRRAAYRKVFELILRMDPLSIATYRESLCKALGIKQRQFNALLKAVADEAPKEASSDEPGIVIETPGGMLGGNLAELIYQPPEGAGAGMGNGHGGGKTFFAVRREDGSIGTVPYIDTDYGVRYRPIPPSSRILSERVVQFPSALGAEMETRALVRLIQSTIHKYVDVDIFYETLAAYYVLFSWLYDCFNTLPYLRALGDAGTGKSRLIQVVGALCYRAIFATGAATVSPIFRMLDKFRGTLVLDEADFQQSDESADLIKILNSGYQRTQGIVLRSGDKNSGFEPEVYIVYGPKVVATRKRFQDWALESRCLTKEMGGPTTRSDIPIDMPMRFFTEEAVAIRNVLLRHRLLHWQPEIELAYDEVDASIEPRLNQVTVALHTMVEDPDLRNDIRGFVREYNRQLITERGMTLASKVLEVIVAQWQIAKDAGTEPDLWLTTIAKKVNGLMDHENYGEDDGDDEHRRRDSDHYVKPKKIGVVVRQHLHLATQRGPHPRRGYVVIWDDARIDGLRKRFGLDDEALVGLLQTLNEIESKHGQQETMNL